MGNSISIIILDYISAKHLYCFYINVLNNLPLFTCSNSSQQLQTTFSNFFGESKEIQSIVQHFGNEFEHCH